MFRDRNWDLVGSAATGESLTMCRKGNVVARLCVFRIEVDLEVGNAFVRRIVVEARGRRRLIEEGRVMCGRLVLACMVNVLPKACPRAINR